MPAPFSSVHVPFVSGARQDIGEIAQENPAQLRRAENVLFTKKGRLTGRPAAVFHEEQVEVGGAGSTLQTSLQTVNTGSTPSGIVPTGFSRSATEGDTPLACWQGAAYYKRGAIWAKSGPHWSLRQTKSAILKTYDPVSAAKSGPVPVGQTLVGVLTSGGGGQGFPILNDQGETTSVSLGVLNAGASDANYSIGGDALVYIDVSTGNVLAHIPTTLPAVTQVTVGTGASTSGLASQRTSSLLANDGFYYVAYVSSTAGRITVVRMDSTGTVTQTLNLNGLGTVQSLALVHNGSNRLGLVWLNLVGPAMNTKVLTITAGTMADSGLNLTLTGTPLNLLGLDVGSLAAGVTHNGLMSILFTRNDGDLYIGGRSFTAATESFITRLVANGLASEKEWDPLFGGVVVGGRTLIGVLNSVDVYNQSSQWIVLDVTALYAAGTVQLGIPVAAGPYLGAARMSPSSVYTTSSSVAFAVAEGLQFSATDRPVPIIRRAGIRRITLSLQGTQAVHANGVTLTSGQVPYVFDGVTTRVEHFVEEMPFIFNTTAVVAGGTLPAGSFTYQATWEVVNAAGQIIRSGASNQVTKTVGAPGVNKTSVVISVPQIWSFNNQIDYVRVRLWATQVNPVNTSPLYFVTELSMNTTALFGSITLDHTTNALGTEERLYETIDTLSDMRAPGADRGVAIAGERVWVADQERLYASKLIKPGIATSWNTEGPNTLTLPSSLGTIQSLASLDTALIVVCSRGAAVVTGPGVDDTGAGPGWSLGVIMGAPGAGETTPRGATTTPVGVVYQAQDGDLWLVDSKGIPTPLSRPLRDQAVTAPITPVDVIMVGATAKTNSLLVASGNQTGLTLKLRVLDLEMNQWATWSLNTSATAYFASINGTVWVQFVGTASTLLALEDFTTGIDAGVINVDAVIETGVLRPSNPAAHGWGRLRGVTLSELRTSADTQVSVTMKVLADQNDRVLMNKTKTTAPTDTSAFPGAGDGVLDFRTSIQRCSYARVLMTISPAVFNVEGLDLWVANTGEPSPTPNRS